MKKRVWILLLVLVLIFGLLGCQAQPQQDATQLQAPTDAPTEPPKPTPEELYTQAVETVNGASELTYTVTDEMVTTVGIDEYTSKSEQTISLKGIGTDSFQAYVQEELTLMGVPLTVDTVYTDGSLYLCMDSYMGESRFTGAMAAADYQLTLPVAALLDLSHYEKVTAEEIAGNYFITCSEGTAPESWAVPEFAHLVESGGTATIHMDGHLQESKYQVTYRQGGYTTVRTVTAKLLKDGEPIVAPADTETYTPVEDPYGARLYTTALYRLQDADSMLGTSTEVITCMSTQVASAEECYYSYYGKHSQLVAAVNQSVVLQDGLQTETYGLLETYENRTLTSRDLNGAEDTRTLSSDEMWEYCQSRLLGQLASTDCIQDITWERISGIDYLELTLNDTYAEQTHEYVSALFYEDPAYLKELSPEFALSKAAMTVMLDTATNQMITNRLDYVSNHTIGGIPYPLTVQASNVYEASSLEAYSFATEKGLPEYEPEEKPTPVFYHVTGTEGQQMWLLGTIHLGDNRTAWMPKEIYDAFEMSDALAVECDVDDLEDGMAGAGELAERITRNYFYLDSTTIADHIPEETYEHGKKLMMATGIPEILTDMVKPFVWESTISEFFVSHGRSLQSAYGVDNRLMALAREQGKEILEVESALFQMEMLSSFSEELQIMMLESVLDSDPSEYYANTEYLYELWCDGDETALREYLSTENSEEMTPEEQALMEEYNKAVQYDRNIGMLEAAKEYLESGDVIFYAVGLAHLLDETNGLVQTLEEAGYTVELVTYS